MQEGQAGPGAKLRVESPVRQGLEFKVRKLQGSRFPRQRPKNRLSKCIQAAGMVCGHSHVNQMEFPLRWPWWGRQGSRGFFQPGLWVWIFPFYPYPHPPGPGPQADSLSLATS